MKKEAKGVVASLTASCIFGLMYYLATLLSPLTGVEIFGWRMVFTLPFLTLFMARAGFWPLITAIKTKLRERPAFLPLLLLSSFLIGVQFWLFLWAPVNGRALQVSLGYLLMPLVMVVLGRVVFGEKLKLYQKLAVALASLGVANQIYQVGGLSWEVMVVAFGFPAYFVLRKKIGTDNLGGLWFDVLFMFPVCLATGLAGDAGIHAYGVRPALIAMVPFLGFLTALSFACFITASRLLPLGVFGLLNYVEPVLLVLVSLLIGERVLPEEIPTYTGVFAAIALLAGGAAHAARKEAPSR